MDRFLCILDSMAIVERLDKIISFDVRGEFGYSGGYGLARYSLGRWGFFEPFAGCYSRKKTLKGWGTSRMAFYRPTNPQTPAQQAWRAKFALAISGYQSLTADQKKALNKEARKYRLSGLTLSVRRYLQANR